MSKGLGRRAGRTPTARAGLRSAVGGVLVFALLGSACTSGGDQEQERQGPAKPRALKQLWSANLAADRPTPADRRSLWRYGTTVAVVYGGSVVGYHADSGKRLWQTNRPSGTNGTICRSTDEANKDGYGAVVLENEDSGRCEQLAIIDLRDGAVGWQRQLKSKARSGQAEINEVSVGQKTVTVDLQCGEIQRFAVRGSGRGEELSSPLEGSKYCSEALHDGSVIAVRKDTATEGTSRKPAFELYDADSGKRLWQQLTDVRGSKLEQLVSSDPVILQTTRRGHTQVSTLDGEGLSDVAIGRPGHMEIVALGGGILVGAYADRPTLHGYDVSSGKRVWHQQRDKELSPIGTQGGGLLSVRSVNQSGKAANWVTNPPSLWVTRHDPRDPRKQRMLGAVAQKGGKTEPLGWDEERLYLQRPTKSGWKIDAYQLPKQGTANRYQGTTVDSPYLEENEHGRAKGEFSQYQVDAACAAVQRPTKKLMGFKRDDLPAPANCTWQEKYEPEHTERTLKVEVTAHQAAGEGGGTGTAAAKRELAKGSSAGGASREAIGGLGPGSYATARAEPDGTASSATAAARYRNVTVRVTASTKASSERLGVDVVVPHQVEQAALRATAEVLRELGANASVPEPPGPPKRQGGAGNVTEVGDVCETLRSEAGRLVPGSEAEDVSNLQEHGTTRLSGCRWKGEAKLSQELKVHAYALPPSAASGQAATEVAKSRFKAWRPGATDVSDDLGAGEEARLYRHEFEDGRNRTHRLLVRQDNVLVHVWYQRWAHPAEKQLDRDVQRAAKAVLDDLTDRG